LSAARQSTRSVRGEFQNPGASCRFATVFSTCGTLSDQSHELRMPLRSLAPFVPRRIVSKCIRNIFGLATAFILRFQNCDDLACWQKE
jgi:hypothetical protein